MGIKTTAVFTESGLMARRLSSLRPDQRIIALTNSREIQNELALIWAVEPLVHSPCDNTEAMVRTGARSLLEAGIVQQGELIVLMAGKLSGLGLSRSVKLHEIGDVDAQQ
jgi:pyruvate kinase